MSDVWRAKRTTMKRKLCLSIELKCCQLDRSTVHMSSVLSGLHNTHFKLIYMTICNLLNFHWYFNVCYHLTENLKLKIKLLFCFSFFNNTFFWVDIFLLNYSNRFDSLTHIESYETLEYQQSIATTPQNLMNVPKISNNNWLRQVVHMFLEMFSNEICISSKYVRFFFIKNMLFCEENWNK